MASPSTSNQNNKGFTLVEVMVVLGILIFIMSFSLIIDIDSFKRDIFASERSTIVSILEKARSRSMNNVYETSHGVCFIAPNYIIFRGRATCMPTSINDERIPANLNIATASTFTSSFPTIVFNQLSGTSAATTIAMTDGVKSANIIINYEGTIKW